VLAWETRDFSWLPGAEVEESRLVTEIVVDPAGHGHDFTRWREGKSHDSAGRLTFEYHSRLPRLRGTEIPLPNGLVPCQREQCFAVG